MADIEKITFFRSYYEAIEDLPDKEYREILDAVFRYVFRGEQPTDLSPVAKGYFILMKPNLDTSMNLSKGGKKGGDKTASLDEASAKPASSLPQASAKPADTDKEKDKGEGIGNRSKDIGDGKKDIGEGVRSVSNETDCSPDVLRVIDEWNALPEPVPKISCIIKGSERDKRLKARIRQYGLDEVCRAVNNIRDSDFLKGGSKEGWVITFDWFVRPSNFAKVLDGNYGPRSGTLEKDLNAYMLDIINEESG